MKKILLWLAVAGLSLAGWGPSWADDNQGWNNHQNSYNHYPQDPGNMGGPYPMVDRVPKPLFLKPNLIPQTNMNLQDPDVPVDENGDQLDYDLDNDPPSPRFMASLTNAAFANQIQRYNRRERGAGRYYWHSFRKIRISHYTDSDGNHWYGGATDETEGKWTMLLYRNGRFWWHDRDNGIWLFYYKNYWWTPDDDDPSLMDVYLNGDYYPCDRMGRLQETEDDPNGWNGDNRNNWGNGGQGGWKHHSDEGDDQGQDWKNRGDHPDNGTGPRDLGESQYTDPAKTRLLKVTGANRDAYLFDTTPAHTLDHVYLASNVTDVQFSNDAMGKAWRITLTFQDGSHKGYNADGHLTMP